MMKFYVRSLIVLGGLVLFLLQGGFAQTPPATPKVNAHLATAKQLEAQGKYAECLPEYAQALASAADEQEASTLRAAMFAASGKMPTPPEMPDDAHRRVVRGELMLKDGSFDRALAEFNEALRLAPYMPKLYYNTALIYGELKQYDQAIRLMHLYLTVAPEAPDKRTAQDQITRWEMRLEQGLPREGALGQQAPSALSKPELRASALAGIWSVIYGNESMRVKQTFEMVAVGEDQLEMNPIKMSNKISKGGDLALSRETTGYFSLTLKGRHLGGVQHMPGRRPDIPVSVEVAEDNREMMMSWTIKGKVVSWVWKREQ